MIDHEKPVRSNTYIIYLQFSSSTLFILSLDINHSKMIIIIILVSVVLSLICGHYISQISGIGLQ